MQEFWKLILISYECIQQIIFPVLPFKDLINKDSEPTASFKIVTGKKTSVSHLRVLFCPYVVRKATINVGTKALNMYHQAQKGFCSIFIEIPQHQKGCPFYVPHRQKIIYSYDVVFGKSFSSAFAYRL